MSCSGHVAAGREHYRKKCRTRSYICNAVARIPTWAAAPTTLQTHCQRGRPQDFVAGTRVPRSGLPRVFVSALECIRMQTPAGRCSCTRSEHSTQREGTRNASDYHCFATIIPIMQTKLWLSLKRLRHFSKLTVNESSKQSVIHFLIMLIMLIQVPS